jgi:hypothetical protein
MVQGDWNDQMTGPSKARMSGLHENRRNVPDGLSLHSRTIFGIDFSGAADAGRRIWIASGKVKGEVLHTDDCFPARAL